MSLIVACVIVTAMTLGYAVRSRGETASKSTVAVIIGTLVVGGMVATTGWLKLQDQRLRDQCTYTVARSDGNRQQWLDLAEWLEEHDVSDDAIVFIKTSLDSNLPQRSVDDCPKA